MPAQSFPWCVPTPDRHPVSSTVAPTWAERLPFRPVAYAAGMIVALGLSTAVVRTLLASGVITGRSAAAVRWNSAAAWLTVVVLAVMVVRLERLPLRTLFRGRPTVSALVVALVFAVILRLFGPVPLLVAAAFVPRRPSAGGRELVIWTLGFAGTLVVGMLAFAAIADALSLGERPAGNEGRSFVTSLSILDRLIIVVTAAATEEVRYRSYFIERLHGLRVSPGAAALLSYLVFVAAHIPFFGLEYVLRITAVGGAAFPILYYLTRNFWACFALHFFLDVFLLAA